MFLFLIIYVGTALGQSNPALLSNQPAKVKAEEIIERARTLISRNVKTEELKKLSLEFDSTRITPGQNGEDRHINVETKLFAAFPNQIRLEIFSDFTTNQHLFTEILNLPRYSQTSDVFVGGKPFNFASNLSDIVPKSTKEKRIASIKEVAFSITFPLILQSSWYQNLEFKFVGEAESRDGKADVVEVTNENNTKYRLFFDKQSHLPVMMVGNLKHPVTNKEIERKYYYSDYREQSGLLIAHKIITQLGDKVFEERRLKKLQINPTFKSNLFEVKEDKVNPYEN